MTRRWALVLVVPLVVAACTTGGDLTVRGADPTPTSPPREAQPSPTPTRPTSPDAATTPEPVPPTEIEPGDRIVVQTADGQLVTIRPDGNNPIELTDAADGYANSQPTWAPDGSRLAWTRVDPLTGQSLVTSARFDRSAWRNFETEGAAFYLSWDPPSRRIGHLSGSDEGIELGVIDVLGNQPSRVLDRGQPYWFSWSPSGQQLLVHAGGVRLDRVDVDDGSVVVIDDFPADFPAPTWTSGDRLLVYADEVDDESFLVTSDDQGEGREALARFDGFLRFVVDATETRIALQAVEPLPDPGVVTASAQPEAPPTPGSADEVGSLDRDILYVMAVDGGVAEPISGDRPVGFFWSPTGETLAYLAAVVVDGEPWLEWRFWTGTDQFSGPRFRPSDVLLNEYLPFFDQYAQSLTFWSPDGSALVYAGADPSGEEGVWVVNAVPGAEPEKVADGVFAAWSPVSAVSAGDAGN